MDIASRQFRDEPHNCVIKLRQNHEKRKDKVYIGCGAGFGGDRPLAALKLLLRVKELNYIILECLAERTLADRYQDMMAGGHGYDSRISQWMRTLLPLTLERGTCIITNMGAMDPLGAQEKVLEISSSLGLNVSVAVAYEVPNSNLESASENSTAMEEGVSTYLGAAPVVECLEKYEPNVIITSRIADAALFLAPMVFELGWNWDNLKQLAQGSLAGHLLECGCQLTGGYFMHPRDKHRDFSYSSLLDLSLPYAEISFDGTVCVSKAENSGGILNFSTCAEQLLYEIGDPDAYVTPDLVVNFLDVEFVALSSCRVVCIGAKPSSRPIPDKLLKLSPKDCGWKGWGEISYGGHECAKRAKAAEYLVTSWMEEAFPGISHRIVSYIIGLDSLKAICVDQDTSIGRSIEDIRLRMDGLFELKEHAVHFSEEFTALYTNGPAGGGGISTGYKKEIVLNKQLVKREDVFWRTGVKHTGPAASRQVQPQENQMPTFSLLARNEDAADNFLHDVSSDVRITPAPSGKKIPLYDIAHSRAGDKGNDLNFSVIPHCPSDVQRLKLVITPEWVKRVVSVLLHSSSFQDSDETSKINTWVDENVDVEIYYLRGIQSLNVVVRNILDGGVNCSRRVDRHGKSISDLILCQEVVLP